MSFDSSFLEHISDSRAFGENWRPFASIEFLYLPLELDLSTAELACDDEILLRAVDSAQRELYPGFRVADVFLSPQTEHPLPLCEFKALDILKRLLKSGSIQGVSFHAQVEDRLHSYTLYRFAVARLVGLLELGRDTSLEQLSECTRWLADDQLSRSLHVAAEAREQSCTFEHYFATEISSLLGLGLYEHAMMYLRWAAQHFPEDALAYQAHLLSVNGEADRALHLLALEEGHSWRTALERGRALLFCQRPREALQEFEYCNLQWPGHFDPILGKGVALRAIGWQGIERALFREALSCFEEVNSLSGYHSAEAFHHRGTIHMALEEYEIAEALFRQAIALAPSPISTRNLCLVLHALDRHQEAYTLFAYLYRHFPLQAQGLEKYFRERPRLVVIASEPAPYHVSIERRIEDARTALRQHGVRLHGDLLDFRRVDSFVNYYAPGGGLIPSSKLRALPQSELVEFFGNIARSLADTLVLHQQAYWVSPPHVAAEQLHIAIANPDGSPQIVSMFQLVLQRLQHGAESDRSMMLEALVAELPEYQTQLEHFSDPFPALPADEERVLVFEHRAEHAATLLEEYGFHVKGTLEDLLVFDEVVDAMLLPHTTLAAACGEGRFGNEEVLTMGLYLGSLCRRHTGGVWYDHRDGFGISLQEMPIVNLYPIARLFKRIDCGVGGDGILNIATLYPSIVCAELIRHVGEEEITRLDVVKELLRERLPRLHEASSIESLARTILNYANKKE